MTPDPDTKAAQRRPHDAERRERIFSAAERAFVRHGFHAATMHHVAEEAGMSAGNLYRYFASKEALVEGLCRCDRDEHASEFEQLSSSGDLCGALATMIVEHLLGKPREKARIAVEMWAEASRNSRIGELMRAFDASTLELLRDLVSAAQANGSAPTTLDADFAARAIFTLVSGLLKRVALEPDFDRAAEAALATGILRALFAGAIAPVAAPAVKERP